mmetsp:Transcript_17594/g.35754  ORF Transcript_17594/g.35754 Transcript_17594/m.35754 type:complete len:321 (+) Transcript_17594:103-1065(+)
MKKALLILNFVLTLVALLLISEYVNEFELAVGCAEKHRGAAEKGGGHLHLRQQDRENDDVERNAENVVDCRALAFGDDLRLERAHGREVHPDASLEDEEAKHDERVARGDNRDEKGKAGYDERVLGDLLNGHGFHYDSKERAPCHAAYHESGEDEAEGESLAFGSRRLECWGPHEHEGVHAALKEGRDSPAEQDGGVGNDGVEALLENLDSFSRGGVGRCLAVVLTPVGLDVSPTDEEDKNGNVKGSAETALHDGPRVALNRGFAAKGLERCELGGEVRDKAGRNGHATVAKNRSGKGLAEPLTLKGPRVVLVDHPRVED